MDYREDALFCALFKIYDNYITPMNTRVSCWKTKVCDDGFTNEGWFVIGMEIRQFQGPPKYLTEVMPISWWDKFNVIVLDKSPAPISSDEDLIKGLLEL